MESYILNIINMLRGKISSEEIPNFIYESVYLVYSIKKNNLFKKNHENESFENLLMILKKTNEIDVERFEFLKSEFEKIKFIEFNEKQFIDYIFDLDDDTLKYIAQKNLYELRKIPISRGLFYTPESVNELVRRILNVNDKDSILDLCSGCGSFLINIAKNNKNCNLTGIEINHESSIISKLRLEVLENDKNLIITSDALTYKDYQKYTKIFCNYPFGIRVDSNRIGCMEKEKKLRFNWSYRNSNSSDWMFINIALTNMSHNGKTAVLMPSSSLFKTIDADYRKELLENGCIECIIGLPEKTFDYTSVSINLVIFSNNNKGVKFIDASNEYISNNFKNELNVDSILKLMNNSESDKVKYIDNKKIIENYSLLSIDNYIGSEEITYHNPHKLSEYILDIFRGYQLSASNEKKLRSEIGKYEVLKISDIDNGIIGEKLIRINLDDDKATRYLIKNDDIIITSKGTRIKIAVANIGQRKIIASGNLIVLRINKEKINPHYLELYLNSKEGQLILQRIQTGSVIISINPKKLADITISTLPIEIQNKVARVYLTHQMEISLTFKHLEQLKKDLDNFYEDEVKELF